MLVAILILVVCKDTVLVFVMLVILVVGVVLVVEVNGIEGMILASKLP